MLLIGIRGQHLAQVHHVRQPQRVELLKAVLQGRKPSSGVNLSLLVLGLRLWPNASLQGVVQVVLSVP